MRQVGKFRFLMRRPPLPKIEDSDDLVNHRYAKEPYPAPVPVPRKLKKHSGDMRPLKEAWDMTLDEERFREGRSAEEVAEDVDYPVPEIIEEPDGSITAVPDRGLVHALLLSHMYGDEHYNPAMESLIEEMVGDIYERVGSSAADAFLNLRLEPLTARYIRFLYRAARKLAEITGTRRPNPRTLREAFRRAGLPTGGEDDPDAQVRPDDPPVQVTVPRNIRR